MTMAIRIAATPMHIAATHNAAGMLHLRLDTAMATHMEGNITAPATRRVIIRLNTMVAITPVGARGSMAKRTVARQMSQKHVHRCRGDRSNTIRVIAGRASGD